MATERMITNRQRIALAYAAEYGAGNVHPATVRALTGRGLLDADGGLTDDGAAALRPPAKKRRRYEYGNDQYRAMLGRLIRGYARRPDLDYEDLAAIRTLRDDLDAAAAAAVRRLMAEGSSWAEIGAGLGITKQAAYARYSKLDA